jgi:hypothetical protein
MLRYVVLHHTGTDNPHFDLLFERAGKDLLGTMRCSDWPPANETAFERIDDHRRVYLEYEGPISANCGEVRRIASGTCTTEVDREDSLLLTLDSGIQVRVPRKLSD